MVGRWNRTWRAGHCIICRPISLRIIGIDMNKRCNGCREWKPHAAFSKASRGSGDRFGLASKCKVCRLKMAMEWRDKNKERAIANQRRWLSNNSEKVKAYSKKWMTENPEWHAAISRKWRIANPGANTAKAARYRAAQKQAMPNWLTAIQHAQIQEFYEIAAARTTQTGINHHVDHIHALQGKNFRGLHVPWNLQVLTMSENASKKNHTMYPEG